LEYVVRAKNVHKSFGSLHVLRGIDLDVSRGETVVIMGRSGSGKSTFLRCLNWLEKPDDGEIFIEDERMGFKLARNRFLEAKGDEISKQREKVGMVFQLFNLFPHMSVLGNVTFALRKVKKLGKEESDAIAWDYLAKVGLTEKAESWPSKLSGGQQQRVAIARALAMQPKVMLFDEATSALDPETVGEVLEVMEHLSEEGMTMIVVTHELRFAREAADRIVFFHEGVIVEEGPVQQVFENPKNQKLKDFLGSVEK